MPAWRVAGVPGTTSPASSVLPFAISAVALAVYLSTLCPAPEGTDSGELVTVAYRLGVAHPPGYPLFTLLAHAFTALPFGSIAWRVSLACGLFGAGAAGLLFLTAVRWLADPWAALLAAGLFAFSPLTWRYTVVAEVFSLNNLLVASLIYLALRLWQAASVHRLYLLAFNTGLLLAHHHTSALIALPLAIGAAVRFRKTLVGPRSVGIAVALAALGSTPYAYLPWAASRKLLASWGDAGTVQGFVDHVLRREYGTFRLVGDGAGASFAANLGLFARDSWEQLLYVGSVLALVGIARAATERGPLLSFGRVLLGTLLVYVVVFHALANIPLARSSDREILSRFWQVPNLVLSLFAAKGLADLAALAGRRVRRVAPIAAVGLVLAQLVLHYRTEDASESRHATEFSRATLESLPEGAVYLARGDLFVNTARYLQDCEGARPDVIVLPLDLLSTAWLAEAVAHRDPGIRMPEGAGGTDLREFLDLNPDRTVFVGIPLSDVEKRSLGRDYQAWNVGFANRILPRDARLSFGDYLAASEAYRRYEPPDPAEIRGRPWASWFYRQYWAREEDRARRLFHATRDAEGYASFRHSAELLERILRLHPGPAPGSYRDLGLAYARLREIEPGVEARMVELLGYYLARSPHDPQAEEIRELIASAGR